VDRLDPNLVNQTYRMKSSGEIKLQTADVLSYPVNDSCIEVYLPNRNNKRAVNRRARQNKAPNATTTVVGIRDSLERRLAKRSDMIDLVGRCLITLGSAGGAGVLLNGFTPASFGVRLASIATNYSRWRIQSLNMNFVIPSTVSAVGIVDDDSLASGEPTSLATVYELRCSLFNQGIPAGGIITGNNMLWKPIDPSRWFYTTSQSSANDLRDVTPGTFAEYCNAATPSWTFECYYSVQLSGGI